MDEDLKAELKAFLPAPAAVRVMTDFAAVASRFTDVPDATRHIGEGEGGDCVYSFLADSNFLAGAEEWCVGRGFELIEARVYALRVSDKCSIRGARACPEAGYYIRPAPPSSGRPTISCGLHTCVEFERYVGGAAHASVRPADADRLILVPLCPYDKCVRGFRKCTQGCDNAECVFRRFVERMKKLIGERRVE